MEPDPLRLRLDFHDESVILHDYGERVVRTKRVSALDVAHALARELDLDTGLLPPDTLWWARTSSGVRVAVWRGSGVWTVRLRTSYDGEPREYRLPMPGLVFVCDHAAPYVFAAKARPTSPEDQLFHAPAFNVFPTGGVCTGTHTFPAEPERVPEAFFESYFAAGHGSGHGRSRSHPDDLLALWEELDGRQEFPLDDLVPVLRVVDAMRLGG